MKKTVSLVLAIIMAACLASVIVSADVDPEIGIRYCHLHGDVVGVQVPGAGHGIPLPVGLVSIIATVISNTM